MVCIIDYQSYYKKINDLPQPCDPSKCAYNHNSCFQMLATNEQSADNGLYYMSSKI